MLQRLFGSRGLLHRDRLFHLSLLQFISRSQQLFGQRCSFAAQPIERLILGCQIGLQIGQSLVGIIEFRGDRFEFRVSSSQRLIDDLQRRFL